MRISIFSAFYPFRGGIAQFNGRLFRAFEKNSDVSAFTFTTQYPKFLFPGTTQYVESKDHADPIPAKRIVNPFNPFTWFKASRKLKASQPDIFIINHWMSFFGPCFAFLTKRIPSGASRVVLIHNLYPHEKRFFDSILIKHFLKKADGYIVMSESVRKDLLNIYPDAKYLQMDHPWYDHFGEKQEKLESQKYFNLDPDKKTLLFFGLIREYKGLDILLEAFELLGEDHQLLIAGEVYGDDEVYLSLIRNNKASERIHFINRYISDDEVKWFFSAADICVLPYRSATQSGVTAVAFHFEVPVVVTDVGGLKKIVDSCDGGVVADTVSSMSVKNAIVELLDPATLNVKRSNIRSFSQNNSWESFAKRVLEFSVSLKK